MSKINQISNSLTKEAHDAFQRALTTKTTGGESFLLSASKVAELVTTHTEWSLSKDSVLSWRRKNVK